MLRFSKKARKYLLALAGIGILVALDRFGISFPGFSGLVLEIVMGLAIAEGVYRVPNSGDTDDGSDQFRGV